MAKKQISNYKFAPGIVVPDTYLYPNAHALLEANKKFIQEEKYSFRYDCWAWEYGSREGSIRISIKWMQIYNFDFMKEMSTRISRNYVAQINKKSAVTFVTYNSSKNCLQFLTSRIKLQRNKLVSVNVWQASD